MRIESSVTAVSWIPSEAITAKVVQASRWRWASSHYDEPLPDHIDDLVALRDADKFRFGNVLQSLDRRQRRRRDPRLRLLRWRRYRRDHAASSARSERHLRRHGVSRPPAGARRHAHLGHLRPDLRRLHRCADAAPCQRAAVRAVAGADRVVDAVAHNQQRRHVATASSSAPARSRGTGCTTTTWTSWPRRASSISTDWFRHSFDNHSPWGDEDSPAFVTTIETALERELSHTLMRAGKPSPRSRKLKKGEHPRRAGRRRPRDVPACSTACSKCRSTGRRSASSVPGPCSANVRCSKAAQRTATLKTLTKCRVAVVAA